jgi:DNA recombination protein RmuC
MDALTLILALAVVALAAAVLWLALRRPAGPSPASLTEATEHLLAVADQRFARQSQAASADLDGKKALIDQRLEQVGVSLQRLNDQLRESEKTRESQAGALSATLKHMGEQTSALTASTSSLREALASTRTRGQWGERMAEDILRLVGLVEGVNYHKQATLESGSRPDFVFLLPGELRLNMDVKFPLDNYLRSLEATTDGERDGFTAAFLKDVRDRVRELRGREYVDPAGGTVDYALLFIPNEAVYTFIHEHDPALLDVALREKVVCCSPLTLFAVLALVRQAADSFALQRSSDEILTLLGRFTREWDKYAEAVEVVGRRLTSAQRAFDEMNGPRRRQLQRPLDRIEVLRAERGLPLAEAASLGLGEGEADGAPGRDEE